MVKCTTPESGTVTCSFVANTLDAGHAVFLTIGNDKRGIGPPGTTIPGGN